MRIIWKSLRLLLFILILVISFNFISCILINKCVDGFIPEQHEMIPDFYREQSGTLDAVWIGASHVYNFYQAPVGWEQSGLAIYPYSTGSQPLAAVPFLIEEVRKSQPQALMIVNLNQIVVSEANHVVIHYFADWMPLSKTKIDMIDYLLENNEGTDIDSPLEYFFPIIRYHSRWNQLTWHDIHYTETGGMKGAKKFGQFLSQVTDVSANERALTSPKELTNHESKILEDILDYCDENNINILFVIVPQYTSDESRDAKYLSAQKYVVDRGYPVLNMKEITEGGVGLDLTSDYWDSLHTNIHGSIKISDYVCHYLAEKYEFIDKRGDPKYASWNEAWDSYSQIIEPYLTEEEIKLLKIH